MKKQIDIIGYFLQDDMLVVANPCAIPLEQLERSIKEHREHKDKRLVTNVMMIAFPLKFPKFKK